MSGSPPGPIHVLVVDDSATFLAACRTALGRLLGPQVLVHGAEGPAEAERLLRQADYDLVLADQFFPGGPTGVALLEAVRASHPRARRVLMTGRPDLDVAFDSVTRARVHGFITKPGSLRALEERLASVLALP